MSIYDAINHFDPGKTNLTVKDGKLVAEEASTVRSSKRRRTEASIEYNWPEEDIQKVIEFINESGHFEAFAKVQNQKLAALFDLIYSRNIQLIQDGKPCDKKVETIMLKAFTAGMAVDDEEILQLLDELKNRGLSTSESLTYLMLFKDLPLPDRIEDLRKGLNLLDAFPNQSLQKDVINAMSKCRINSYDKRLEILELLTGVDENMLKYVCKADIDESLNLMLQIYSNSSLDDRKNWVYNLGQFELIKARAPDLRTAYFFCKIPLTFKELEPFLEESALTKDSAAILIEIKMAENLRLIIEDAQDNEKLFDLLIKFIGPQIDSILYSKDDQLYSKVDQSWFEKFIKTAFKIKETEVTSVLNFLNKLKKVGFDSYRKISEIQEIINKVDSNKRASVLTIASNLLEGYEYSDLQKLKDSGLQTLIDVSVYLEENPAFVKIAKYLTEKKYSLLSVKSNLEILSKIPKGPLEIIIAIQFEKMSLSFDEIVFVSYIVSKTDLSITEIQHVLEDDSFNFVEKLVELFSGSGKLEQLEKILSEIFDELNLNEDQVKVFYNLLREIMQEVESREESISNSVIKKILINHPRINESGKLLLSKLLSYNYLSEETFTTLDDNINNLDNDHERVMNIALEFLEHFDTSTQVPVKFSKFLDQMQSIVKIYDKVDDKDFIEVLKLIYFKCKICEEKGRINRFFEVYNEHPDKVAMVAFLKSIKLEGKPVNEIMASSILFSQILLDDQEISIFNELENNDQHPLLRNKLIDNLNSIVENPNLFQGNSEFFIDVIYEIKNSDLFNKLLSKIYRYNENAVLIFSEIFQKCTELKLSVFGLQLEDLKEENQLDSILQTTLDFLRYIDPTKLTDLDKLLRDIIDSIEALGNQRQQHIESAKFIISNGVSLSKIIDTIKWFSVIPLDSRQKIIDLVQKFGITNDQLIYAYFLTKTDLSEEEIEIIKSKPTEDVLKEILQNHPEGIIKVLDELSKDPQGINYFLPFLPSLEELVAPFLAAPRSDLQDTLNEKMWECKLLLGLIDDDSTEPEDIYYRLRTLQLREQRSLIADYPSITLPGGERLNLDLFRQVDKVLTYGDLPKELFEKPRDATFKSLKKIYTDLNVRYEKASAEKKAQMQGVIQGYERSFLEILEETKLIHDQHIEDWLLIPENVDQTRIIPSHVFKLHYLMQQLMKESSDIGPNGLSPQEELFLAWSEAIINCEVGLMTGISLIYGSYKAQEGIKSQNYEEAIRKSAINNVKATVIAAISDPAFLCEVSDLPEVHQNEHLILHVKNRLNEFLGLGEPIEYDPYGGIVYSSLRQRSTKELVEILFRHLPKERIVRVLQAYYNNAMYTPESRMTPHLVKYFKKLGMKNAFTMTDDEEQRMMISEDAVLKLLENESLLMASRD